MKQWRRLQQGWIRCLPLLFALHCSSVIAAPLIKLSADFAHADLVQHADLLADTSRQLTVEQIANQPIANNFSPANSAQFRSEKSGTYWLRFGIDNPLPEAQILVLNLRNPDDISVAAFSSSLQPLPIQHAPLLHLLIPPHSKQLYYLRINSNAIEISQFELLSLNRYIATIRLHSWLGGILQSCLLLIAAAALFAGLLRANRAYGSLAGYCTAFALYQFFFRADFTPLAFSHVLSWNYRHPFLQSCILLANICCIRIAQHLLITQNRSSKATHSLNLLLILTIVAIPILFLLTAYTGILLVITLLLLTQIATITAALYNFLSSHRRELLFYALLRTIIFAVTLGSTFAWQTSSSFRTLTDNLIPIAMVLEAASVFRILLWHSVEQQRKRSIGERDIAVLEAEARGRTDVIADVGRRVRTPISGVLGMLDMLQDTALSVTQVDYVNTIRRASNELLNTIDEISDVSRLQIHTTQLQQNIFDPHALIAECVDGFRNAAAAHHLELINDTAPELPAYVSGDLTRLRQIILQLLHQVVSQHEGGDIVLRVQQSQSDWLHFDIQTRAAIAAKTANDIDRRINFQGSANVRFAIARQLIEMLGGRIQIDDLADGNLHAWFDLELPTVERSVPGSFHDTTLQGKQLLVIDDNATLRDVLERQLTHLGMTVYTAHSASEGLARLRNQITLSHPLDVLLIDTDIPELRQNDWAQRLHNEIKPAPIIICLSSDPVHDATAQLLNSRRVLVKPINHTSLKITLIEAFKQREQRLLPVSRTRQGAIRCLFAEDNLINAKVLAGMLDKLGVTYTAASNGQEAVEACRRDRFDIVLMDWDMPVMDGWEASRRIREMFENRGMSSMPIIALTANTVEELGERARQPVMDAHLVKPVQLQNLRELLEQWTGKIVIPSGELPN
jgi:CheY-like chemotaxis protein/signal transduction histidine kinase